MRVSQARLSVFVLLLAVLAAALIRILPGARSANDTPPTEQPQSSNKHLPPAENLRVRVVASQTNLKALLDPAAAAWADAAPTSILLNRTPRVYQTEPPFTGTVPRLEVSALRTEGKLVMRLEWDDATKNAPEAAPRKTGEAGDPDKLYKRPTSATSHFADAVAVMFPENWQGPEFPSLQMGDAKNPVRIFYWNASRGAEELAAAGRTTPKSVGHAIVHRADHAADKWRVTLELPDQADGTPAGFAVWDGASNDRDGLKFFSIWYVLVAK